MQELTKASLAWAILLKVENLSLQSLAQNPQELEANRSADSRQQGSDHVQCYSYSDQVRPMAVGDEERSELLRESWRKKRTTRMLIESPPPAKRTKLSIFTDGKAVEYGHA